VETAMLPRRIYINIRAIHDMSNIMFNLKIQMGKSALNDCSEFILRIWGYNAICKLISHSTII